MNCKLYAVEVDVFNGSLWYMSVFDDKLDNDQSVWYVADADGRSHNWPIKFTNSHFFLKLTFKLFKIFTTKLNPT